MAMYMFLFLPKIVIFDEENKKKVENSWGVQFNANFHEE